MAYYRNEDILNRYLYDLYNTNYFCGYNLPSDFKERLLIFKRSTFSFFGCYDDNLYFYSSNGNFNANAYAVLLQYNVNENRFFYNDLFLPDTDVRTSFVDYVSVYPTSTIFDSDNNFTSTFLQRVNVNNDIYDDLKNSNRPSEIIISMLYVAIPLILFVIGLKVLKKGLFK